jgi:hypothetical protein
MQRLRERMTQGAPNATQPVAPGAPAPTAPLPAQAALPAPTASRPTPAPGA